MILTIAGNTPFYSSDMKEILLNTANCKVDYNNKMIANQSIESIQFSNYSVTASKRTTSG